MRNRLAPLIASFGRDRRGNVAIASALLLPVACLLAAIAVDEGAIFAERRNMQGLTDLAAIAAAASPARGREAALATFRENGLSTVRGVEAMRSDALAVPSAAPQAKVEPGRYDSRGTVPVGRRFVPGAQPTNAFRVTLTTKAAQYFSAGFLFLPEMQTVATAHAAAEASFSVGSRLAGLDGGIANAVLGALLGGSVSLSAMDYRALADARINVPTALDWMAKSLKLEAASYSDLLQTNVPLNQFFGSLASLPGLDKPAGSALRALASTAAQKKELRLGELFDLGVTATRLPIGRRTRGIGATAAAADIVGAAAAIANRDRQLEFKLAGNYPGILGVTLHLAIGEPMQASPWLGTGEEPGTVRTAQTRLSAEFSLAGPGGVLGTAIRLPVVAEAATAEAELADIRCQAGKPRPTSVALDATPGIAQLRIAEAAAGSLADFRNGPRFTPAMLVKTPLASITGSAWLSMSDAAPTRLLFSAHEIGDGKTKRAQSRGYVAAPVAALLGSLRLDVEVLGNGAGLPSDLGASLSRTLAVHAKSVDLVLASALATLGVSLGQADVTVHGGVCNRAVLVQ